MNFQRENRLQSSSQAQHVFVVTSRSDKILFVVSTHLKLNPYQGWRDFFFSRLEKEASYVKQLLILVFSEQIAVFDCVRI